MEAMGVIGVMVNCALIGLSGQVDRMFPDITATQTIILIAALEVSRPKRLQWGRPQLTE
jgi:anoctamin-8